MRNKTPACQGPPLFPVLLDASVTAECRIRLVHVVRTEPFKEKLLKYPLEAVVQRVVTDVVTLTVEADNEFEALHKADQVLKIFPEPHDIPGVDYCFVEHRTNGDVEVLSLKEQDDIGVIGG